MIEKYKNEHLQQCVDLLIKTYNIPPWNEQWTCETAKEHLEELILNKKFAGFVLWKESDIIGAAFGYAKTWWNDNHFFVEDFFITPGQQRMGYGKMILTAIEEYASREGLSRVVLLTNRKYPSFNFYLKNGFSYAENTVFMFKNII